MRTSLVRVEVDVRWNYQHRKADFFLWQWWVEEPAQERRTRSKE